MKQSVKNSLLILCTALVLVSMLTACQVEKAAEPIDRIDLSSQSDTVTLFGKGFLSTALNERDMAIAPDGNRLIYTLENDDQTRRILVMMEKGEQGWSEGELLPFSGKGNDIEPFFSIDGSRLFFASDRPIFGDSTRKDYNIWYADWTEKDWGEVVPLSKTINSEKNEFYPSVSQNGNLYFTATYAGGIGSEDIYCSRFVEGHYSRPEVLDTMINTKTYEFNAYVSPEEDLLVFSSYGRPDGQGGGDLYMSRKDATGNWTQSVNLGPEINSKKLDYCPFVDFSNGNFYFTSNRTTASKQAFESVEAFRKAANKALNGKSNIYRIRLDKIL